MTATTKTSHIPTELEQALDRYHSAVLAIGHGDPEPYMRLWSRAADVSLFGAWGPCKQSWEQLSQTFRWVAIRFTGGDLLAEEQIVSVSGDLAYTVGYEKGLMSVDGADPAPMVIRVTQVYRLEDGEWYLVHRHGDFAPTDESAGKLG
jgi:ketosteroid isomerase-like protein